MSRARIEGRQRIAVIGSGVSGMVAAWLLRQAHEVTVFEQDPRLGGHTHTVSVDLPSGRYDVDTGFIVFNERTYPNFTALLQQLGVSSQPTTMSFSMHCERTGREWNGSSLRQLFVQPSNLLRPSFWGMLRDVRRFHRRAPEVLAAEGEPTLADLVQQHGYGRTFVEHYLVPMGAAIWSMPPQQLLSMPARFFVRFFANHGMLQVRDRPQWRTVVGGSRTYLERLVAGLSGRIRRSSPVRALQRDGDGVLVHVPGRRPERFDHAIVATHSDQALSLLADPSAAERQLLGAIPYQANDVVLHTDTRLLPRARAAWAAWNYRVPLLPTDRVTVTYCMNLLQRLPAKETLCVTLNDDGVIDPATVLRRFVYHHPVFTAAGIDAQARLPEIQGARRTWFCGAWCGYGFHEDGVASALRVAADFGVALVDGKNEAAA